MSKTTTPTPTFKIAIIGAGPAGCTLGRLLHLASIPFTIFEGETSPNVRSQGGTLDLRDATGLAAISAAGLHSEFLKFARYDGEAMCIADKNLKHYFTVAGRESTGKTKSARPEIDRVKLRAILLESVPKESIKWGHRLRSVGEDLSLRFENGEEEKGFDLVVGADGAWSKTRLFLSDQKPFYAGVCDIEQHISDVKERFPDLHRLVNKGSLYCFSDGKAVTAQQIGDGSLKVSNYAVRDESWAKEHDASKMEPNAIKSLLLKEYAEWAPELRKLIESVDDHGAVMRALYMLPIGFSWQSKPGVTIIGDAAHVMVPFAGEGANLSMADAMHLAQWIQKSTDKASLHENVAKFEQELFVRMKPIQQISHDNMEDMFLAAGAPRTTIDSYLTRMVKHMQGPVVGTLTGVMIHVYYWFFRMLH
jgi:2-polyprenyl-6-methoxyphenol hydroxylase-like FAD-dependent oxidoreductase